MNSRGDYCDDDDDDHHAEDRVAAAIDLSDQVRSIFEWNAASLVCVGVGVLKPLGSVRKEKGFAGGVVPRQVRQSCTTFSKQASELFLRREGRVF